MKLQKMFSFSLLDNVSSRVSCRVIVWSELSPATIEDTSLGHVPMTQSLSTVRVAVTCVDCMEMGEGDPVEQSPLLQC